MIVGDRYGNTYHKGFEIESIDGHHKFVVVKNIPNFSEYKIGYIGTWTPITSPITWQYLGNFSKSRNLVSLYEILCEDQ